MAEPRFQLTTMDAVDRLRELPDASVDLVVTDPPYESLEKHRAVGTTTRLKNSKASSNKWFQIFPNDRFEELFTEIHRVLAKDRHFYLFCDQETMFVAKPIGEKVGFKFWKPLIWDKCLAPDTPVCSDRGVVRIDTIQSGDHVALPEGGFARVKAVRRTRAPAVELSLSDGSKLVSSRDHRFVRADGTIAEAAELDVGARLATRPVRLAKEEYLHLDDYIPDYEAVFELPDTSKCLWCGRVFDGSRAAAAHQARFCDEARSKESMAAELGISAKRLRRWMHRGRIPLLWAEKLGLTDHLGKRVQCTLQNDVELFHPRRIKLDYALGKLVGLYAAEGSWQAAGISFALHAEEKHLRRHIGRVARSLGMRSRVHIDGNRAVVLVSFKVMKYLMGAFVGGNNARDKYFKPLVYAAAPEFRRGVFDGLIEGDGHWSETQQRETVCLASPDLSHFVRRYVEELGWQATIRRFENECAGGWRVRFDPANKADVLRVEAIRELGTIDLVDISIDHPDELFLLGNGVVTHNCKIGMGYHYRARYECILFFEKGKRKLNDLGIPDVISVPRIHKGYPAEKPPDVSDVLVRQSTQEGELVLDPFMGSGSVGVASVRLGRNFAGNDICEEAVAITQQRLIEEGASPDGLLEPRDPATGLPPQLGLGFR